MPRLRARIISSAHRAIVAALLATGCGSNESTSAVEAAGEALTGPALAPSTFLPGIVSQPGVSRAYIAIAPDGDTIYLARYQEFGSDGLVSIEISRRDGDRWTSPVTAPFSGSFHDHQPCVAPNGRYLYFVSRRPVDGTPREDYEPWRVEILADGFGEPEHLAVLGSPEGEYSPYVARSGRIYFSSTRDGGLGSGDLYFAEPEGDGFGEPRNLGLPVNGPSGEWGSVVDADEALLVFESSNRAENLTESGDLYFSRRIDGAWSTPRHLPAPLASNESDLGPRISLDGRSLLFSSNRAGAVATFELPLDAALASAEPGTEATSR